MQNSEIPDGYQVSLLPSGRSFQVNTQQTILQAALQSGVQLPSSCRNGTCRACLCRKISGEVSYRIEWPGLSRDEKEEGWILPCVATPVSDLQLLVPQVRPLSQDAASVSHPNDTDRAR